MSSSQVLSGLPGGGANGVEVKLPFDTIVSGDTLGNYDTGNDEYVADRDMEVRVRLYAMAPALGRNQVLKLNIRINGTLRRQGFQIKLASDDINFADTTVECSLIREISSGDVITAHALLQSFASTASTTLPTSRSRVGFEVEVLRDNTP